MSADASTIINVVGWSGLVLGCLYKWREFVPDLLGWVWRQLRRPFVACGCCMHDDQPPVVGVQIGAAVLLRSASQNNIRLLREEDIEVEMSVRRQRRGSDCADEDQKIALHEAQPTLHSPLGIDVIIDTMSSSSTSTTSATTTTTAATTTTTPAVSASAVAQASGKVCTRVLQTRSNKVLADLNDVYSLGVDVLDEASTVLSKLYQQLGITSPVDATTLLTLTQTSLTTLLTDLASKLDPLLPASLQAVFISAIPLVINEIIQVETKVVAAVTKEFPAGVLSCITGSTTTKVVTPATTTTVAVTPSSQLTYTSACEAPASSGATTVVATAAATTVKLN